MLTTQNKLTLQQAVEEEKLDLLNRQPFVDQLIRVTNMLADNSKNACFAINGKWGVGKTYVLDLFEKQIRDYTQEGTTLDKFLVLHYNCWQYDYYEEPLIAIVSAIVDAIDEEVCLLSTETKIKIKAAMREIAVEFLHGAAQFAKHKTGIDFEKGVSVLNKAQERAKGKEQDSHKYDTFFDFKKKLTKLKEQIGSLSQEQTVLFIVDELDRCLPEYAIKVLERLHHIFDDIPNVQVILSVDKQQLENTVTQIYGTNTRVDTYLAKFIDFELYLDEGTIGESFDQRFKVYVKNFETMWKGTNDTDVEQFVSELLEGISTRQRIALVEKCQLIHSMISADAVMDKSIMCVELFLGLLQSCGLHLDNAKRNFSINNLFVENPSATQPILKQVTKGLRIISQRYRAAQSGSSFEIYLRHIPNTDSYHVRTSDVFGVSLAAYRRVIRFEKDHWVQGEKECGSIQDHIAKFWETLQIIN